MNVTVSSESSVSVTPQVQCKKAKDLNSDTEIKQSKSFVKRKKRRRRADSDPGPNRPVYESP